VVSDFAFVHMHRMAQKAQRLRAFGENWRRQTARRACMYMLAAAAAETANCKFMSKMRQNTFGGRALPQWVLDCGMTFHLDYGGRDLPSDNLW